ncbi:uncharacterized protein L969DRAFT_19815 [Mixia osmundae IAM 14324]|uniref:STAS domain-containing protein n=1 Tax=Mixia osmundae (strain CBS 9802 / IAM 14324 / JCM 22182 / KY 12970) TaxID=764103 RepID=G7E282_MIXOS|nr:uncharacterized protein L969DRAFT_19815 [Mixia osmundae IAM 14324]KEI36814.1 hypothetical protein L969DRAFT_19815 [Mixia osmundae IAM 14324]GAA96942.1 hypothetical protein E5Q_03616 [Mixia osmundae IAM 14324]
MNTPRLASTPNVSRPQSPLRRDFGGAGASTQRNLRSPSPSGGRRDRTETSSLLGDDLEGGQRYGSSFIANDSTVQPAAAISREQRRAIRKENWQQMRKTVKKRSKYYVPILEWLPNYDISTFTGDFLAGLTMTFLLVPQSMSYASSLARIDPVHGLFGACIPSFIYALLGTCRQLSVGPEAALCLLIGQAIQSVWADLPDSVPQHEKDKIAVSIASLITFQSGLITFLLGFLRLGFMDAVLSRALLRGFVTAIAFVIFIAQLIPMLGLETLAETTKASKGNTIEKAIFLVRHVWSLHRLTTIISAVALALLIGARVAKKKLVAKRRWVQYFPEVLSVVILATILTSVFHWDKQGLKILGHVTAGKVKLHFPMHHTSDYFFDTLGIASTIAIVGYVDSIVAAKGQAARFNYSVSPNRELVALGGANLGASLITGTLPGFGSITRSRVNANAGARTPMASLITSACILLTTLFLLRFLHFLPKCILASVVCLVVYSILQETPEDVHFFLKMQAWNDLALMTITFILTLFNVQTGIIVSIALSLIMVVQKGSNMNIRILGRVAGTSNWDLLDPDDPEMDETPGTLIVRIRENLTFANAGALKERLRRLEIYGHRRHHPSDAPYRGEAKILVFHWADVDNRMDASAIQVLLETVETYTRRGVAVYFCHVGTLQLHQLAQGGIYKLLGHSNFQPNVAACLAAAETAAAPLQTSGGSFDDSIIYRR